MGKRVIQNPIEIHPEGEVKFVPCNETRMQELINSTLRVTPDVIQIGECRSPEMLNAMTDAMARSKGGGLFTVMNTEDIFKERRIEPTPILQELNWIDK